MKHSCEQCLDIRATVGTQLLKHRFVPRAYVMLPQSVHAWADGLCLRKEWAANIYIRAQFISRGVFIAKLSTHAHPACVAFLCRTARKCRSNEQQALQITGIDCPPPPPPPPLSPFAKSASVNSKLAMCAPQPSRYVRGDHWEGPEWHQRSRAQVHVFWGQIRCALAPNPRFANDLLLLRVPCPAFRVVSNVSRSRLKLSTVRLFSQRK